MNIPAARDAVIDGFPNIVMPNIVMSDGQTTPPAGTLRACR